jgi:molybdopterin converting factor small subunit
MRCVQVEVMPWLSRYVVAGCEEPVILEKEVGEGATVRDLLEEMTSENQEFRTVIFDAQTGKLAGYVGLVLNGRFLELAGGVEATVKPGDVLRLMPGFSGG